MRLQRLAFGALTCAAAGLPTVAAAQMGGLGGEAKPWRVGLSASGVYDSNVARSGQAKADERDIRKGDLLYNTSATISGAQTYGRISVFAQGALGYSFHQYNKQLNSERSGLNGGAATRVGPCSPSVNASYNATQSELVDLQESAVDNVTRTIVYGAQVSCTVGPNLGASFSASRSEARNSAGDRSTSNNTSDSLSASVFYGFAGIGSFSLGYGYSKSKFPERDNIGIPDDGFYNDSINVGYQRNFGSRLSMDATYGRTRVHRDFALPGEKKSFGTDTYSLTASYTVSPRLSLTANASRAITPSQQLGKTVDLNTSAALRASYRLGPRISLGGGASYNQVKSNQGATEPVLVVTNSKVRGIDASATFSSTSNWSLAVTGRYAQRDADLPEFNYSSYTVGVSAQVSF